MHCINVVCVDIHGHIIWATFECIKFIILIVLETRITVVVYTMTAMNLIGVVV